MIRHRGSGAKHEIHENCGCLASHSRCLGITLLLEGHAFQQALRGGSPWRTRHGGFYGARLMMYRPARTLVFTPQQDRLIGCNFLARRSFECDASLVSFLGEWEGWRTTSDIAELTQGDDELVEESILAMVDQSALVVQDSELHRREEAFIGQWRWGLPTAMMHFCVQDADYMDASEAQAAQQRQQAISTPPALVSRNIARERVIELPSIRSDALLDLMARRRTIRAAGRPSINVGQLADCLFAGLGITGQTDGVTGKLPLSMTPSGGARNPYEAYVIAKRVEGLAPGIYHYSAADHDLGLILRGETCPFSDLVGGQDWADEMPCLILLCADFRRPMWKYEDANAYRVVLIEAGHIGQNIMLAATSHGLSACPTAALSHSIIAENLGLETPLVAPVYGLTLAVPGVEPSLRTLQ